MPENWIENGLIFFPLVSAQMLIAASQTKQAWSLADHNLVIPVMSMINYPVLSVMLNKNVYNRPVQMATADTYI